MATPQVGDETTLKITKVNATYGHEDWKNRNTGQWQWIHEGSKEFHIFKYLTAGRGWVRKSDPVVLRDGHADIHVKVLDINEDRVALVQVLNGFDLRTLNFKKKPYIRKDGTASPQVAITYTHQDDWKDPNVPEEDTYGSKLKGLYGVYDYRRKSVDEIRKIFASCNNVDHFVPGCVMYVSLKDLNKV